MRSFFSRFQKNDLERYRDDFSRATLLKNRDFIYVVTESGYRMTSWDHATYACFLEPAAALETIGREAKNAMQASRFILNKMELSTFMDPDAGKTRQKEWEANTMQRFDYKKKSNLYGHLKKVGLNLAKGEITISPTRKRKSASWVGLDEQKDILISASSTEIELGKAILSAIEHCQLPDD